MTLPRTPWIQPPEHPHIFSGSCWWKNHHTRTWYSVVFAHTILLFTTDDTIFCYNKIIYLNLLHSLLLSLSMNHSSVDVCLQSYTERRRVSSTTVSMSLSIYANVGKLIIPTPLRLSPPCAASLSRNILAKNKIHQKYTTLLYLEILRKIYITRASV